MTEQTQLPVLHDAVFERVDVDWESDRVHVDLFRVPGGPIRLVATGLHSMSLSRREDWGPSVYVDRARLERVADGMLLVLEVQSGDELAITAAAISVVDR